MGIVKHRPTVTVHGPRVIPVGRPCRLRVTVDCKERVPVNGIVVELIGTAEPLAHGQRHTYGGHFGRQFCRLVAQLVAGRVELPQGQHEYDAIFELPRGTPGTYSGSILMISWTSKVHIDIPWWPDRRGFFSMHVAGEGTTNRAAPQVFVSDARGPKGRGPYAELSLGSTTIEPGGEIRGRIALSNVDHNRYRAVEFALAAKETFKPHGSSVDRPARWRQALSAPVENEAIPFHLRVPDTLTPGFRRTRMALEWQLELELDVAWGRNPVLWIPLEVRLPDVVGSGETVEASPLAVGSERLQQIWRKAARDAGFDYADERMAKLVSGRRLTIRREHRGRRGLCLVAEAMLREVDIGLHVRKGLLRCRDDRHSELIGAATDELASAVPLRDADDARIRWATDEAGTRVEPLVAVAEATERLVRAFVDARAELPVPADMADMEEAFARVARRLGGRFERAGVDIFGARDEVPFSLETRWDHDGRLSCTALTVQSLIPIDARFHGAWHGADRPSELPEGLAALLDDALGLSIDEERIELYFPPRPDDLDALAERVEGLVAVGLTLSMRAGGYR